MSMYPDWKPEADPGDRVAFDLGYSAALLHRALELLSAIKCDYNLDVGTRADLNELLDSINDFSRKRLGLRDQLYQGAEALGAREEQRALAYPDGPGASPEDLQKERERGQWLEKLQKLIKEGNYLLWSFEHEAWWGPKRTGYVDEPEQAGIYSLAEAKAICLEANRYCAPGQFNEAMVPLELPK